MNKQRESLVFNGNIIEKYQIKKGILKNVHGNILSSFFCEKIMLIIICVYEKLIKAYGKACILRVRDSSIGQ